MMPKEKIVGVIPIGDVPDMAPKVIAANILAFLNFPAKILPRVEVPENAYDKKRLQYNAAALIKSIATAGFESFHKLIGVCDLDIFIPIFTHVFGEAMQGGNCAVVSLFRLQKKHLFHTPNSHTYERLAKVALHEAGHLFHMIHCEDELCLMHYSADIDNLDDIQMRFCRYCSKFINNIIES